MMNTKSQLQGQDGTKLKKRWVMLALAFLATVLNYVDRLGFNYLAADGALREIISDETFGYIGTCFFVGYLVSNFISGFLIDKLGTRLGYAFCMAFWTTATLLQALAMLPFHFGIIRALLGVGEAGNWPAGIKLIGEWFTPEERSTATGIFNSGAAVGAIITPPLIIWLGTAYGWRAAFVIIGLLGYIWLAAFWFIYYTPKNALKASKQRTLPPMKLLKTRFVSWLTVSKVFMDPIWYFITFWIGRYLVDVHKWDLSDISKFVILPFVVADLGNILGGMFTQFIIKKGVSVARARKIAVALFGLMMAVSLISGPFIINSPAMALVILSLAGFGYAGYTANTMAFPGDVVPASATASVWGVASVGAGLGGVIFQSLSGITVESFSEAYSYTMAYNTVFVAYGVMAIIGLSIVLFLMGPLKKDDELHAFVETENNER